MYVPWRHLHSVHLSSERPWEDANAHLARIRYPQWVQRMLIRDPEVIRVHLDPAKRDLLVLPDNFAKLTGELETPATRSRDAFHGNNRTLAHPGHDEQMTSHRGSHSRSSLL